MTSFVLALLLLLQPPQLSIPKQPHAPQIERVEFQEIHYQLPAREMNPENIWLASADQKVPWSHTTEPISAKKLWEKAPRRGKGIKVAVLDTGIDKEHFDLVGRIVAEKDFTNSRSGTKDVQGHGTHCAGIVGAADNDRGVVGIAPECSFLLGKVLGDSGSGSSRGIALGIRWAVDNGADVISMSLGGGAPDPETRAAIQYAVSKKVYVVAAAGNSGPRDNTTEYPGSYEECICVGSSNSAGKISSFSSRGKALDISAPGEGILSTYPGDKLATLSGTSMATPFVAGCVAAILSEYDNKGFARPTTAEMIVQIQKVAFDLPPTGIDNTSGAGIIVPDAVAVVGQNPPSPPSPTPVIGQVEINLDDLTPAARERVLAADPDFGGIIIKRKTTTVEGLVEEFSVPTTLPTFFRVKIKGDWYEIPSTVITFKPEWLAKPTTLIITLHKGTVTKVEVK